MNDSKFEKMKNVTPNQSNWNLPNIACMVGGFMVFPPIGFATVAWLVFGKNVDIIGSAKNKYEEYAPGVKSSFDKYKTKGSTDNSAYNDYKADQVAAYEAEIERQNNQVSEEEKLFNEFVKSRQTDKDRAEFADFLKSKQAGEKNAKS